MHLTIAAVSDSLLIGALGFFISLRAPRKLKWKIIVGSCFVVLAVSGLMLSLEQNRRANEQSTALYDAQKSATSKMDGIHDVLVQMSLDLKSQIIETAAKEVAAIAASRTLVSQRVIAVATHSPASSEKPLLDRALDANPQLQGFQAHWSDAFDKMQGEIRTRWTSPYYTSASAQAKEDMIEADRRVMRWREDGINREETSFYRKNYEAAFESLRRELIPMAGRRRECRLRRSSRHLLLFPGYLLGF